MKKIHIAIVGLLVLLVYSCNPNKQIYEELDAMRVPYNEAIEYSLTDDDYTTMKSLALALATNEEDSTLASELASYKSFSPTRSEAYFIPLFLNKTFIALDSASSAVITYKYDYKFMFTDEQKLALTDTFTTTDDIPAIIEQNITTPVADDFLYVTYKFDDGTDTVSAASLFQYDGTEWLIPEDALVLSDEDYDMMGTGSGEPGQYGNFSSSSDPNHYLPIFLEMKYPFAVANTTVQLVYKYYSSGTTSIYYIKCLFDGADWYLYETKSNQFIHNGTDWVFDPTVKHVMGKSDYQLIVDWVTTNDSLSVYLDANYPQNTEWYFGASSYYGNFDFRDYKHQGNDHFGELTGLDAEEIKEVILARIPTALNVVLETVYPDAQPFSNGVPVYYEVYFDGYTGKYSTYMCKFLCTGVGTFEYVEGPTFIE